MTHEPLHAHQVAALTEYVRLERLRHHADGLAQVCGRAGTALEAERHTHPLQHLNVVVDLKRVVKVEQVLVSVTASWLNRYSYL